MSFVQENEAVGPRHGGFDGPHRVHDPYPRNNSREPYIGSVDNTTAGWDGSAGVRVSDAPSEPNHLQRFVAGHRRE